MAQDVVQALERRLHDAAVRDTWVQEETTPEYLQHCKVTDVAEVWAELVEAQLKEAERACNCLELLAARGGSGGKRPKKRNLSADDDNREIPVVPWDARRLSQTPDAVPMLLSQLSKSGLWGGVWYVLCYCLFVIAFTCVAEYSNHVIFS